MEAPRSAERELKRVKRLIKNRESAQASRERKKAYVEMLEQHISTGSESVNELIGEYRQLHKEVIKAYQIMLVKGSHSLTRSVLPLRAAQTFPAHCLQAIARLFGHMMDGPGAFAYTATDFPITNVTLNTRLPCRVYEMPSQASIAPSFVILHPVSTQVPPPVCSIPPASPSSIMVIIPIGSFPAAEWGGLLILPFPCAPPIPSVEEPMRHKEVVEAVCKALGDEASNVTRSARGFISRCVAACSENQSRHGGLAVTGASLSFGDPTPVNLPVLAVASSSAIQCLPIILQACCEMHRVATFVAL